MFEVLGLGGSSALRGFGVPGLEFGFILGVEILGRFGGLSGLGGGAGGWGGEGLDTGPSSNERGSGSA